MSDYLDPNNEELLKDFFAEAEMQVEMLEQNILVLEQDSSNSDAIDEIFRAAHTLKGASATVQMTELTEFTHIVEDVLDDIRSGKVKTSSSITDVLLESIDVIKAMLGARADGEIYTSDISSVRNSLKSILDQRGSGITAGKAVTPPPTASRTGSSSTAKAPAQVVASGDSSQGVIVSEYEYQEMKEAADGLPLVCIIVGFDKNNPMNSVGGIQVFASLKSVGQVLKTIPDFDALYSDQYFPEVRYFVSTARQEGDIRSKISISDVTTTIEVVPVVKAGQTVSVSASRSNAQKEEPDERFESAEAKTSAMTATSSIEKNNDEEENDQKELKESRSAPNETKKSNQMGGSVLRVESRRIDELLNLVSETVINKATFNQVSNNFTDLLNNFQTIQSEYRQTAKQLFDSLSEYLEKVHKGQSVKEIKKEFMDRFGSIITSFDPVNAYLKSSIGKFKSTAQNLGRITGELQEGVMRIRMVPISQIFSRFPRLVRDVSKQLAKEINLVIEGEDTELDKSVIEDLLDPLIHCVRNAIDHGIEPMDVRRKVGKPEKGELTLKASNEGNMILIEITDDGKGIDVESVRQKAIDRGIIHPNKALTDVEAFNLIFDPGFSTASKITNISGRGVGLDVVKKSIEKLNGNVTVTSERNKGSKFLIKIPLTLAIIQGLLVRVGTEIYAIPITAVLDSHRIKPDEIRMIDNYEVFNVRDDVISLMRLSRLFRIPTDEHREYLFVVIVGSGDKKMGLIVDALIGEEDVVIKPLRDHYTNAPGIAGANITGDGTVSLIIDVSQLLELGQNREIEARKQREMAFK